MVKNIHRIENLIIALVAIVMISTDYTNWWLYLISVIIPDLSLLGYLINKKIGSLIYNLVHNYALALLLLIMGIVPTPIRSMVFTFLGIGLVIHVGIDRFLGFGLKYENDFKKTHI